MFAWLWRSIASLLLLSIFLVPDTRANESDVTCDDFNSWIWAQAVFDSDPEMYAALDPDGNDIACENLNVNGFGPVTWTDSIPDNVIPVTISRIVDGDTIRVIMPDNTEERVRLLHIDSPELSGSVAQCGATEATDYLTWMLSFATNNTVYLEQDVSERDRYDRLLAYVWFEMENSPQPYMANDAMVMTGWAES